MKIHQQAIPLFAFFLSLTTFAHSQDRPSEIPQEKLHIYLLIGQSNMAGRAKISPNDKQALSSCYLLNDKDEWEKAQNPFNRYSTIRKNIKIQKMNPGYGFATTMLEKSPQITLGLVVNAKGGTKIAQWGKGTEFYKEALRRTQEAQKHGTLKGILWHQGEGDSRRSSSYLKKLKQIITDLRADLDAPELPFVAGQIHYDAKHKAHTLNINKEIAKLPQELAFTGYVSSEGLTTQDHTHFDTEGMKKLGKRYAEEIIRLQSKTPAPSPAEAQE